MIKLNYPKTVDEAVDIVEYILLDIEKDCIMKTKEESLVYTDIIYGDWLRKNLGLLEENYELIEDCKVSDPDDASFVIIEALWKSLNTKHH